MTARGSHLRLVGGTEVDPRRYVAVRQAGPHHDNPGCWLRMDAAPLGSHSVWAPRTEPRSIERLISSKANGMAMGVMELPSETIVWTNDNPAARAWLPPADPVQLTLDWTAPPASSEPSMMTTPTNDQEEPHALPNH